MWSSSEVSAGEPRLGQPRRGTRSKGGADGCGVAETRAGPENGVMKENPPDGRRPDDVSRETSDDSGGGVDLPAEADVEAGLRRLGIPASSGSVRKLVRHAELMLEENRRQNLTRLTSPRDVLVRHVLDSASAIPFMESSPAGTVVDIGAGAGYPGVVLCVLGCRHVVLAEAERRKAEFLRTVVGALGLDAEVVASRAEEVALERRESFAVVSARAVARLASLVELASPLLFLGGRLIALKGASVSEELQAGDAAGRLCGMMRVDCARVEVSGSEREHTVVVYERQGPALQGLPRRPGAAQRRPLA